jgi:hypothetical protein
MNARTFGIIGMSLLIVVFLSVAIFSGRLLPLSLSTWPGLIGGIIIGVTFCLYGESHWPKRGDIATRSADVLKHTLLPHVTEMSLKVVSVIVVVGLSIFALYMGLSLRSVYGNIGLSAFIILGIYLIYKNITHK